MLSPQAVATTMGKTGAKQMTKTMVYKAVKRADFEYSNAARGYVYRGEKISDAEAEKLKHKWAKKDLMDNAKKDGSFTPESLEMFKTLVNHVSPRELTAKQQALTYHSLKRYTDCVFNLYEVTAKQTPPAKLKRPYSMPRLDGTDNPWNQGKRENDVYIYKGIEYKGIEAETAMHKVVIASELTAIAGLDNQLANLANETGVALFSEFIEVAHQNNDLKDLTYVFFDYVKHLIVTIDRYFDLKLKSNVSVSISVNRVAGYSRYSIVQRK